MTCTADAPHTVTQGDVEHQYQHQQLVVQHRFRDLDTAHLGRGPRSASTFYKDNVIVTIMHDVMTHAEKALAENEHEEAINQMRHLSVRGPRDAGAT